MIKNIWFKMLLNSKNRLVYQNGSELKYDNYACMAI